MVNVVRSVYKQLFELLYPIYCYGCRYEWTAEQGLCDACQQALQPVVSTVLLVTQKKQIPIFAAYAYRGPICDIIRAKKRSDACASKILARLIDDVLHELRGQIDCFIAVPLHPSRQAERGFNQAEVMVQLLSNLWKIPYEKVIIRSKNTAYQASVSAVGRHENVRDAFEWIDDAARNRLHKKRICIVDDLFTTGATVASLSRLVMTATPESITTIVAARAIDD